LACEPVFAQAGDEPIRVDVDVVNVLCTVSDKRGALITNLRKEDFEVRENGRKQEIRYFARDTDLPLTVAMLMDVSGSVRQALDAEREAAGRFFDVVLRPTTRCCWASPARWFYGRILPRPPSGSTMRWNNCTRFRSAVSLPLDNPRPAPCSTTRCIKPL
jgi:hypothetical protein